MQISETKIPGCYEITPKIFSDSRGSFIKTFHEEVFSGYELETDFAEEYYSVSHFNVFRGLHFQLPPQEHTKMVYCVSGKVMDFVVDLRVGSPSYGKAETFELTSNKGNIIYIPAGLAHGFYVTSETAIMMYKVSTVYSPEHDAGILWNSVGITGVSNNPIISERDSSFVSFDRFESPFVYGS